jgi:hypothetical protein
MNVSTIVVSREEAERKLSQYRSIVGRRRVAEDDKLQSLYASVARGARVLNLAGAFQQTGLNQWGEPRLAIARGDWQDVKFYPGRQLKTWTSHPGCGGFSGAERWNENATVSNIVLPPNTFPADELTNKVLVSKVPHVPPSVRPRYGLHNYHILFEVERWAVYPVDPYLLRRIAGMLYVVEAEWELTELEASLLSAMGQSA